MSDQPPSKAFTLLILLFMGVTGMAALGLLFSPIPVAPGSRTGVPGRPAGLFDDQKSGEAIQARVAKQANTRIDRDSSLDYSSGFEGEVEGGESAAPSGQAPAPMPPASVRQPSGNEEALLKESVPEWSPGTAEKLGSQEGLLSALAKKMFKHPKVMRALFNNKLVVDAYMKRGLVKKNCQSASALKSYLSDGKSGGGVAEEIALVKSALQSPGVGSAFAGTRMASALGSCSSLKTLMSDSAAIGDIRAANTELSGLISNPAVMMSVAANPEAMSMYKSLPK